MADVVHWEFFNKSKEVSRGSNCLDGRGGGRRRKNNKSERSWLVRVWRTIDKERRGVARFYTAAAAAAAAERKAPLLLLLALRTRASLTVNESPTDQGLPISSECSFGRAWSPSTLTAAVQTRLCAPPCCIEKTRDDNRAGDRALFWEALAIFFISLSQNVSLFPSHCAVADPIQSIYITETECAWTCTEREREKESLAPLRARCTGAKALVVGETVGDVDCVHTGRRRHHIGEEVERERRWGGRGEKVRGSHPKTFLVLSHHPLWRQQSFSIKIALSMCVRRPPVSAFLLARRPNFPNSLSNIDTRGKKKRERKESANRKKPNANPGRNTWQWAGSNKLSHWIRLFSSLFAFARLTFFLPK